MLLLAAVLPACGHTERVAPTPSLVATSPTPQPTLTPGNYTLTTLYANLPNAPVSVRRVGDSLLLATEDGGLWRLGPNGRTLLAKITVSSRDQNGLMSFEVAGRTLYVYYSADECGRCVRLDAYEFDAWSLGAGRRLFEIPLDPLYKYHIGGDVRYEDGYLYVGVGDASDGYDANDSGQRDDLPGSILRVVPATGETVLWARGFRNPWRMAWDRGDLYVGDVGQDHEEELDRVEQGGNYGWRVFEGKTCFETWRCPLVSGLTPPLYTYGHDVGCAVLGGPVYRGSEMPELAGRLVFGDFCQGQVWALDLVHGGATLLVDTDGALVDIELDGEGLLVLDFGKRTLSRLVRG